MNNRKRKSLKLTFEENTPEGQMIAYIQQLPFDNQTLALQTLQARFLPFVIDKSDRNFQEIALQCACMCESWAKVIREYASLQTSHTSELTSDRAVSRAVLPHQEEVSTNNEDRLDLETNLNSSPESSQKPLVSQPEDTEDEDEWEQQKQERMKIQQMFLGEFTS